MKTLLSALTVALLALGETDWKSYQNSRGYSLRYPSCWSIAPEEYESEGDKLKDATVLVLKKQAGCEPLNVGSSIYVYMRSRSSEEVKSLLENIKENEKVEKGEWRSPEIIFYKQDEENPRAIWSIQMLSQNQIRWEFENLCKKNSARATTQTILTPKLKSAIQSGKVELPGEILKIMRSLKCIQN